MGRICRDNDIQDLIDPVEDKVGLVSRSALELIYAEKTLASYRAKTPLLAVNKNYIVPLGFSLADWALQEGPAPLFTESGEAYIETTWGWIQAQYRGRDLRLIGYGALAAINDWLETQTRHGFREEGRVVEWKYGPNYQNMETSRVPVEPLPEIHSAYPWLGKSISEYTKDFFDSTAAILIIIGPPGTGKTSFLRSMIQASNGTAFVTYDTNLLSEDGLFADFIGDEQANMMIFEDADTYLGSRRESGNQMMHRFLNVSDGLVSPLKGKKIIFTTNLPSAEEIDPALTRPGRCYEVLYFRNLSNVEAGAVAKEMYGATAPVLENRSYTLAEIVNFERIEATKSRKKIGF